MPNLYELTGNMLTLQELLLNPPEELDEQAIIDTLEAVQGEYDFKLESCAKVVKNLEADIETYKAESKRLSDKAKSLKNNVDRLKQAMFNSMKTTGTTKVKGQLFTVAIQKNGGKLPIIVDVPTEDLPDNLIKVVESPDMDAIAKLIESGNTQYAHYGERGESLRIK